MFAAVLDTSMLWPSLQRDFLLSLAAEGSYSARWSTAILDELTHHEAKKLIERGTPEGKAERAAQRLIDQMSTAFDDALVTDWEPLEGTYGLPDPDDEHVVGAAVMGKSEVIVTENLKHFPAAKLPASIRAVPARTSPTTPCGSTSHRRAGLCSRYASAVDGTARSSRQPVC